MSGFFFRNWQPVLLTFGVLMLTGCPSSSDTKTDPAAPAAKPFVGQEVKIGAPAGLGFAEDSRNVLDEWSAETGATFAVKDIDGWKKSGPATQALEQTRGLVTLFPLTRLGETTAAGAWQPIPESFKGTNGLNWNDILPGVRENVCAPGRVPTLVPISLPVLVCYYRDDLLRKAKLEPPQTWDEYQELLKKLPEWATGKTAVEPWSPEFRATMLLARSASHAKPPGFFSFLFEMETGEPLISGPGFVRGLEQAKAAWPLLAKQSATMSPADCRREILEGRAAMAIALETGPGDPALLFGPAASAEGTSLQEKKDAKPEPIKSNANPRPEGLRIAFTPLPGARESYNLTTRSWEGRNDRNLNRVSLTGFAGLVAGVSSSLSGTEQSAAWSALARLTRPEGRPPFPAGVLGVSRESHFEIPRTFVGNQLQEDEAQRYVNAVAVSLRDDSQVVLELPIPKRDDYRDALTHGVTRCLEGKADPAAALQEVNKEWTELLKRDGQEKVRDDYRRSLGQRPALKS